MKRDLVEIRRALSGDSNGFGESEALRELASPIDPKWQCREPKHSGGEFRQGIEFA